MSDLFQGTQMASPEVAVNAERMPVVFARDGEAFANSRDVAAFFEKQHKDVLRAIENLNCSIEFNRRNFAPVDFVDAKGERRPSIDMTRDGFAFVGLGFTGAKAGVFKEKYIQAFNVMEAELRGRPAIDPMKVLNDPSAMRGLLLTYTEKVIALEASNKAMQADVETLERIADSNGTFNRTTTAKMLGVTPHTLIRWMRTNGWTYKRTGCDDDIAYQSKIAAGLLEHKIRTGPRPDGTEWSSTSVRVTPRGLTMLAKAFPPVFEKA